MILEANDEKCLTCGHLVTYHGPSGCAGTYNSGPFEVVGCKCTESK